MFTNTKMDDGPCTLAHSEELKEKFEADGDLYQYDALIERDFLFRISDIDRSIKVCIRNMLFIVLRKRLLVARTFILLTYIMHDHLTNYI